VLDGRVAFPEIGLTEPDRSERRPIALERFLAAIDDEREPLVSDALSSAFRDGDCLIALYIEDEKVLNSPPHMRRFLDRTLGISARADGVSILGSSVLIADSAVCLPDFERIVARLVESQMLFLMVFGVQEPHDFLVDWDAIYAGKQVPVAAYLRLGEVGLFRSSLRSQDVFELSVIRLA
jgi:hypothetical protein